jgi:tRNA-Thr(GGU) m(6)t(6)A37 methyltransferase TsaA
VESSTGFEFEAIGIIHSPFKEKFGIPRQAGLVPGINGVLELLPPFNRPEAVAELDGYSHLWIQFVFHHAQRQQWQPTVRPPRLGGNRRVGVFASRAPFRPNPIGLSVVALERIVAEPGRVELHLSGIDMVDGTPVLDVKPYVPYVDSISEARSGFADAPPPPRLQVRFSERAEQQLRERADGNELRMTIERLLELDPRPAYQEQTERLYGFRLYDFDLRWRVVDGCAEVMELGANGQGGPE